MGSFWVASLLPEANKDLVRSWHGSGAAALWLLTLPGVLAATIADISAELSHSSLPPPVHRPMLGTQNTLHTYLLDE